MKTKLLFSAIVMTLSLNTIFAQFTDQALIPHWGQAATDHLVELNIVNGNANGQLKPRAKINRAEFLKIVTLATQVELKKQSTRSFPDVLPTDWFSPYVHTAVSQGWAQGYPDGNFRPSDYVNRAEIAKILSQAFDLTVPKAQSGSAWFDRYSQALENTATLPYQTTLEDFDAGTEPTRIEVFEQLHRFLSPSAEDKATAPTPAGPLPDGQTKAIPDSNDDKFLTFTPAPAESQAKLNVSTGDSGQKQNVSSGTKNISLLNLKITSSGGAAKLNGLQFRRIGNGQYQDFSNLWLTKGSQVLSAKVLPQSDFVYLALNSPLSLSSNQTITLKSDIADSAQPSSSRWVLFLPDWIDTDAKATIGLFPVGGRDINIK